MRSFTVKRASQSPARPCVNFSPRSTRPWIWRPCVYCAVVETRGSTPQKPGAAMLVFPDGGQVGTLGGGCVEAEVKRGRFRLHAGGRAEVRTFHLDDIQGWDDGLICGGRMTILLDPCPPGRRRPAITADCTSSRERAAASPKPSSSPTPPAWPRATASSSTPTASLADQVGQSLRDWPRAGAVVGPSAARDAARRRLPSDSAARRALPDRRRPRRPGDGPLRRRGGL